MNSTNFSKLDEDVDSAMFKRLPNNMDLMQGLFLCPLTFCLSFVFLADKLKIPNQLLAMIYGTLIGVAYYFVPFLQREILYFWKPDNVIVLCHPIMIAKVAFTMDIYVFSKSKWQILIVATIATGIFILVFGFLVIVMTNRVVNLVNVVAAGTTLASIDVPDVLTELNRIKNLEVVMDGESIFGAALCIMTYSFCMGFYNYVITEWYHVFFLYCRYIIFGLVLGYIIGKTSALLFRLFYHDSYNATVTLFSSCYLAYFVCEQYIYASATICTFFVGYCMGRERSRLSPDIDAKVQIVLDNSYNAVEFLNCIVLSATVTYEMMKLYSGFDFAVAIGVYIMGNVLRILIFLVLSPILSRLGLGFNITTLLTISWAAKRGSLQLLQVVYIAYYNTTEILGTELLCFTIVYLTLSFLINMTSLRYILKYFGLIEFTMARKHNITKCIQMLMEKKHRILFTLKTTRLLSDLNWELIHRVTLLENPYASTGVDNMIRASNEFETYCPSCTKVIPYLSSLKEVHELFRDVKTKMLNCQRISLVRQFELGLLRRTELEILLQYVETALNSAELEIRYNSIMELFNIDRTILKWQTRMNLKKIYSPQLIWRQRTAQYFPQCCRSKWLIYIKYVFIALNTALILAWIILFCYEEPSAMTMLWIGYGMIIFFLLEVVFNILAYNCLTIYRLYFKHIWHIADAIFLILDITAFIASYEFDFHYIRIACLLRTLFIDQIDVQITSLMHKYLTKKVERKLAHAYCFGLAIVVSMEEVQENLHSMCKFSDVRAFLAKRVQEDKMRLMGKMALVQLTRPAVAVTKSTYQLEMAILKAISTAALEIYNAGVMEEFEFRILRKIIERTTKKIHPTSAVPLNSSKTMLREVPWMGSDQQMFEFLNANITMRIWESGELICDNGLLKMTYKPNLTILDKLKKFGELPIKELLSNTNFEEAEEEYLFMGSSIGELSFLTNRSFDCRIEAIRTTSALVITKDVLKQACELNTDPVYGLICRMWKHVSCNIMYRLLMDKLNYHNIAITSLHSLLNRAFVPDISHYRIFSVSNLIDDIILLDGMAIDHNTKDKYTAPCCIPRSIHQLQIPQDLGAIGVRTKIIVIPRSTINSFTVMQTTEDMSEIVAFAQSTAPVRHHEVRRQKREHALLMIEDGKNLNQAKIERRTTNSITEANISNILQYISTKKDSK